ncbi:MAG: tetratricopeptide repeat protein [Acidimicrobiia bacterium]
MAQVFVSHAWIDRSPERVAGRPERGMVQRFVEALEAAWLTVFVDEARIDDFDDIPVEVQAGLAASTVFVAWFSDQYALRRACAWELTAAVLADGTGRRILAVNPEANAEHLKGSPLAAERVAACPALDDDAAWAALAARVAARCEELGATSFGPLRSQAPVWIPERRVAAHTFTGRAQELWALDTALRGHPVTGAATAKGVAVVEGMGGVGKTLLALEYAHRYGGAWPGGVVWLSGRGYDRSEVSRATPALRREQRLSELTTVAIGLGVDLEPSNKLADPAQREVALRAGIGAALAARNGAVLWVVDDLGPDLGDDEVRGWLAPGGSQQAVSLVTSRTTTYGGLLKPIAIGQLGDAEGYALLTQTYPPTDASEQAAARELVAVLGGHAQALDVTRAAISSPSGYRRQLDRLGDAERTVSQLGQLAELVRGALPGGHERDVAATLALSIDRLEPSARALLRVACCFDSVPLPFDVLDELVASALRRRWFRRGPVDVALPVRAQRLVEASLATPIDDDAIVVHRLVALVARAHLGTVEAFRAELFDRTREVLVATFAKHDATQVAAPLQRVAALAGVLPWKEAHPLGGWRALHASRDGRFADAITLNERTLADYERVLGVDHPDTLTSRSNLANSYWSAGRVAEAITLEERTLADCERVLGVDHPDTLNSRGNLASSYGSVGRFDEAITLNERTLADCERVLGVDHPDTLTSRGNLASSYLSVGRFDEAITLHERTLADRERVLGVDHPHTLTSRSNLASSYWSVGRVDEAITLQERTLADCERVLGVDHPHTLTSRKNLVHWRAERASQGGP